MLPVLKRDMTAQLGPRNVLEMEKTLLYLCLHDGGIVDLTALSSNLGVSKATAKHFLDLFEAAHLVYKLSPYGYGKQVLMGKHKYYLADAAISGSVLLKGKSLLQNDAKLGAAVETAFFVLLAVAELTPLRLASDSDYVPEPALPVLLVKTAGCSHSAPRRGRLRPWLDN
jgi:predicted AAA+ superfamily ATPase